MCPWSCAALVTLAHGLRSTGSPVAVRTKPACVTHKVHVASSSSWNFKFSTEGESVVATVFLTQFLVSLRIGEDCVMRQRSAQRRDWRVFLFYDWAKRGHSAFFQPVYLFVFNVVVTKRVGQPLWNSIWYLVQWPNYYVFMKIYFMTYLYINIPEIVPSLCTASNPWICYSPGIVSSPITTRSKRYLQQNRKISVWLNNAIFPFWTLYLYKTSRTWVWGTFI